MNQDNNPAPQARTGNIWMIGPDDLIPLDIEVTRVDLKKQKEEISMQTANATQTTTQAENKSLFQLDMDFEDILERLEDMALNGEHDPEEIERLEAALEIDSFDFHRKAEDYGFKIQHLELRAQELKDKAATWTQMARTKEALAKKLKERLVQSMERRGQKKVETESHLLSLRSSKAVEIISADMVPDEFLAFKMSSSPDKARIKQAIQRGIEVPGAAVVERNSLQIK